MAFPTPDKFESLQARRQIVDMEQRGDITLRVVDVLRAAVAARMGEGYSDLFVGVTIKEQIPTASPVAWGDPCRCVVNELLAAGYEARYSVHPGGDNAQIEWRSPDAARGWWRRWRDRREGWEQPTGKAGGDGEA